MGRFPAHDLKRVALFGIITFLSLRFRPEFDSLKTKHGWSDWQIDLLVMVISAIVIYVVYSLLFARPLMTVRWIALGDYGEQLGPSLHVRKDDPKQQFILMIDLVSDSALGIFVISLVKRLRLGPVIRLGSPPYVRLVAERNCTSFVEPGPSGYWGVRSEWEATVSRGMLNCRSIVTFPVAPQTWIASNQHEMAYAVEGHGSSQMSWAGMVIRRVLAWFVVVKAKVTYIYVQ
jgi:hypothetical protein